MRRQGYFRRLTRRLDADQSLLQPPRSLVRRWEADDVARIVPRAPETTYAASPPAPPHRVEAPRVEVTVEQPVPQPPWLGQPQAPVAKEAEPVAREEVPPPADEPPPLRAPPEVDTPPIMPRSEPAAPVPVDLVPSRPKAAAKERLVEVVRDRIVDAAPVAVAGAKPLKAESTPLQPIPPVPPRPVVEPELRRANSVRATQPEQTRRLDPVRRRLDMPDEPVRRRTVDAARASEPVPAIHIDTIEVKVEAPVPPPSTIALPLSQLKTAETPPAPARLARGFATTIGLRQA